YIGDMRKARIAAVSPLLEHALKDRNEVHRKSLTSVYEGVDGSHRSDDDSLGSSRYF
ncbi:hypothetical protein L195_g062656, partial [Trifolium pratense]